MYGKSAAYYDVIYAAAGKDYAREAQRLHELIQQHKRSPGTALLDVACGTGGHIGLLRQHYTVEGLDISPDMLAIARRKHPDVVLHRADMADFNLGRQFDIIVCLFSSIAIVRTAPRLQQTLQAMSRHIHPGGVVIIEPWILPEVARAGLVSAVFVDQPDLKIARMNVTRLEDGMTVLDFHHLVATPAGVEYFIERHDIGLFSHEDYLGAFRGAGLDVVHDPEGLIGRGLYIGTRPLT